MRLARWDSKHRRELIAQRDAETPRWIRIRLPAMLATVFVVLIATAGVLIIRSDSDPARHPVTNSPTNASRNAVGPAPARPANLVAEAAPPPTFPVSHRPRPLVLLGEADTVSGFPDDDSKIAFMDGDVDLATTLPTAPRTRDGYPVRSAADAVRQITNAHSCCVTTSTRLQINSVRLGDSEYLTDRGNRMLPAWDIRFAGLSTIVTVLAVARSARFPVRGDAGTLTVSNNGRSVTVYFVAHHAARGPCDQEYRSVLALSQSTTAIRISVRVRAAPPVTTPSGVMCADVGAAAPAHTGAPQPGSPDTKTVRLDAPLGNRLAVDAHNEAYLVTTIE